MGSFMAAARRAESGAEFSLEFPQRSYEENESRVQAAIIPSSTPSHNQHFTPNLVPNSSAAWATAAYLYLNLLRVDGQWTPGTPGDSRLLRWLLDWVRIKLDDTDQMITRSYIGELWLWRVVIGAYALSVAGSTTVAENADEHVDGSVDHEDESQREAANLVDWFSEQLSRRSQATWAPEWENAKEVLEKIRWLQIPGSLGELVLERIWQDSVRNSDVG
jgi:hypothetical protein